MKSSLVWRLSVATPIEKSTSVAAGGITRCISAKHTLTSRI